MASHTVNQLSWAAARLRRFPLAAAVVADQANVASVENDATPASSPIVEGRLAQRTGDPYAEVDVLLAQGLISTLSPAGCPEKLDHLAWPRSSPSDSAAS